jgi:hypothetical protein
VLERSGIDIVDDFPFMLRTLEACLRVFQHSANHQKLRIREFRRGAVHHAVEIDGSDGAVL